MLEPTISLQPTSPLSPLFSSPPQHLASLQRTITLALKSRSVKFARPGVTNRLVEAMMNE